MQKEKIPWHKNDIFHDDAAGFPLEHHLPLTEPEVISSDAVENDIEETE